MNPQLPDLNRASFDELNRIADQLSSGHVIPGWLNVQQVRVSALDALAADEIVLGPNDELTPIDLYPANSIYRARTVGMVEDLVAMRRSAMYNSVAYPTSIYAAPIYPGIVFQVPEPAIFTAFPRPSAFAQQEAIVYIPTGQLFEDSYIVVETAKVPTTVPSTIRKALLELIVRRAESVFRLRLRVYGAAQRAHEYLITHLSFHLLHGAHPPRPASSIESPA